LNKISIGAWIVKSYQDFFQAFFSCAIIWLLPQQISQFYIISIRPTILTLQDRCTNLKGHAFLLSS
jgi:hypothetical protein